MLKRFLLAALLCLAPSLAFAQATLLQGGGWSSGHFPMYSGSGGQQPIVVDSGPASGGGVGLGINELLQVNRSGNGDTTAPFASNGTGPLGTHNCFYDAPTTNSTGFHYFCIDANAQGGGLMTYGAGGAASTLPFNFNINGTTYQFPFVTGGIVGPSTSVVNDIACWNNTTGTLLKDCGVAPSLSANNTWTGTNTFGNTSTFNGTANFTSTFKISGTTESFPASGIIVGTTDVQTLTNKSISADQINSGILAVSNGGTGTNTSTGSGPVVLSNSSSLTTPSLGVASAVTINRVALTQPASGSTLTIADGKTLTASNSLTLAGTDGSTLNIGTGGTLGTAAYTATTAYVPSNTQITNSLSGNVSLNNTSNYFDGPSMAQGSSGTWFASGTVTLNDSAGVARFDAKLWDGTTVIASGVIESRATGSPVSLSLSGYLSSPAGNIKISVKDESSTSGAILFNQSGNSKDSTVSAFRVQ